MTFTISATVPPIQEIYLLPHNQVHIISNTGEPIATSFEIGGIQYTLMNCDLPTGKYIDTVCDLVTVPNIFVFKPYHLSKS